MRKLFWLSICTSLPCIAAPLYAQDYYSGRDVIDACEICYRVKETSGAIFLESLQNEGLPVYNRLPYNIKTGEKLTFYGPVQNVHPLLFRNSIEFYRIAAAAFPSDEIIKNAKCKDRISFDLYINPQKEKVEMMTITLYKLYKEDAHIILSVNPEYLKDIELEIKNKLKVSGLAPYKDISFIFTNARFFFIDLVPFIPSPLMDWVKAETNRCISRMSSTGISISAINDSTSLVHDAGLDKSGIEGIKKQLFSMFHLENCPDKSLQQHYFQLSEIKTAGDLYYWVGRQLITMDNVDSVFPRGKASRSAQEI